MDRVKLSELQQKFETMAENTWGEGGSMPIPNMTIDDMQAMKEMGLILGFDGEDFDGEGAKAQELYEWAKEGRSAEDALLVIKNAITRTGDNTRGKSLLKKVHLWASLQDSIVSLRKRQEALEDVNESSRQYTTSD